ncbi:TetR/AcrR family transcriptional regulator [bacterium]|nr:TetR/AcrR family transcriptional regulator [bacterium]
MGIQERKEREKELRRNAIIDAAESVIFTKGYWMTTMDDVADAAELSKGTIYLYFKTKEELYWAITLRGLKILTDFFQKAYNEAETGLQKVFLMGQSFFRFSSEHPDYFNALGYYEIKETDPAAAETVSSMCDHEGMECLDLLIRALSEGIRDGSINPEINPGTAAVILWGQAAGVIQVMAMKGDHLQRRHGIDLSSITDDYFRFTRCFLENKNAAR